MTIKRGKALFITSTLVAALSATPLWAQTSTTQTSKLSGTYGTFAGSSTNSTALVTGLRDGKQITLTSTTPGVSSAMTRVRLVGRAGATSATRAHQTSTSPASLVSRRPACSKPVRR